MDAKLEAAKEALEEFAHEMAEGNNVEDAWAIRGIIDALEWNYGSQTGRIDDVCPVDPLYSKDQLATRTALLEALKV